MFSGHRAIVSCHSLIAEQFNLRQRPLLTRISRNSSKSIRLVVTLQTPLPLHTFCNTNSSRIAKHFAPFKFNHGINGRRCIFGGRKTTFRHIFIVYKNICYDHNSAPPRRKKTSFKYANRTWIYFIHDKNNRKTKIMLNECVWSKLNSCRPSFGVVLEINHDFVCTNLKTTVLVRLQKNCRTAALHTHELFHL